MQATHILVLETENGANLLKIKQFTKDAADTVLNGERAYHIFHVKMITALLLNEMRSYKPDRAPSEEEIAAIAIASTLHDIGKTQIPQSILDHPGTLSPVEYDIVKKHAVFGEQLIRGAQNEGVDPKIVEHAAKIARYHHERIDGTGYPEGLRGDAIPLSAQAVALADAYDALTTARSYKEAFSQDVALQMISSGMCGVFDAALVECLMRVVNHQTLISFREALQRRRSVTEVAASLHLNRILMVGNTEYLTEEFIRDTFPKGKVMIAGDTELKNSDKIRLLGAHKTSMHTILGTYEFDLILFFSAGLRFRSTDKNDAEELRELLQCAAQLQKDTKILYLSPPDAAFQEKTAKGIMTSANEAMCEFYAKNQGLDVKIVQIPYLFSGTYKKDFLYGVFEALFHGKTVKLPADAEAKMHFLSLFDLSDLIARIVDNWKKGSGILSVGDEFNITFEDFAEKLGKLNESAKIEFTSSHATGKLKTVNAALRNEYGWFARISILEELSDEYGRYLSIKEAETVTPWERVKRWFTSHSLAVRIFELILFFLLSELFIRLTDSTIIFSIVDFRTIFIVIMATLYGMTFGFAAATLSSISYFLARVAGGTNPMTIFYEPTNWIAFVFFFLIGGLCGYTNLKKEDRCHFLENQTKMMENKLNFINGIYEDALKDKKELKKQIISSKDSFGKIFDITRRLNTLAPQQLYLQIMETFEEVLENKSIAVYSIRPGTAFGRLEVASRDLLDVAARSISIDTYGPVIADLKDGGIFKNTALQAEFPMYAAGVYRGDDLILMIFLWHADMEQRSLYYINLFKILRDLAQMSLLRAYDYSMALLEKQYIPGTHIMNASYFEECLKNFDALAEKKMSSYSLLSFGLNGHTLREADAMLTGKIRTTDVLGLTKGDDLRLILAQATKKDLEFILPRFEGLDLTVTVLK